MTSTDNLEDAPPPPPHGEEETLKETADGTCEQANPYESSVLLLLKRVFAWLDAKG